MASAVCVHFQKGYCKFKGKCRHLHISELCSSSNCSSDSCQLRHPSNCRFFTLYGSCKYGIKCAYRHDSSFIDQLRIMNKNIEELATRLSRVEEAIKSFDLLPTSASTLETEPILSDASISQLDGNLSLLSIDRLDAETCTALKNMPDKKS